MKPDRPTRRMVAMRVRGFVSLVIAIAGCGGTPAAVATDECGRAVELRLSRGARGERVGVQRVRRRRRTGPAWAFQLRGRRGQRLRLPGPSRGVHRTDCGSRATRSRRHTMITSPRRAPRDLAPRGCEASPTGDPSRCGALCLRRSNPEPPRSPCRCSRRRALTCSSAR